MSHPPPEHMPYDIRAIVFDVDGVLVRPMAFADVLEHEYGLTLEDTAGFFKGPFRSCILGEADLKAELPSFLMDWGWPHSLEEFVKQWFEADSTVDPDLLGFVTAARRGGLPCHVASTQERYRAAYLEQEMGFGRVFDRLFFSCHIGCRKPDPRFYEFVTSELSVDPSGILFLDDFAENVEAARACGWQAEHHTWGMNVSAIASKYGVDSVGV